MRIKSNILPGKSFCILGFHVWSYLDLWAKETSLALIFVDLLDFYLSATAQVRVSPFTFQESSLPCLQKHSVAFFFTVFLVFRVPTWNIDELLKLNLASTGENVTWLFCCFSYRLLSKQVCWLTEAAFLFLDVCNFWVLVCYNPEARPE